MLPPVEFLRQRPRSPAFAGSLHIGSADSTAAISHHSLSLPVRAQRKTSSARMCLGARSIVARACCRQYLRRRHRRWQTHYRRYRCAAPSTNSHAVVSTLAPHLCRRRPALPVWRTTQHHRRVVPDANPRSACQLAALHRRVFRATVTCSGKSAAANRPLLNRCCQLLLNSSDAMSTFGSAALWLRGTFRLTFGFSLPRLAVNSII